MRATRRSSRLLLVILTVFWAAGSPQPAGAAQFVSVTVPGIRYVSQLTEPAPSGWRGATATPYCAAAASLAVLGSFGLPDLVNPLQTLFAIGQRGNTFRDEQGLDPAGVSYLMRQFGGEGRVHMYENRFVALTELIGRMNARVPVVIFAEAGNHAEVVYGYQANAATGEVTGLYAQDPYTGFDGLVSASDFFGQYRWWGSTFSAAGNLWRGNYVFVSYREFAGGPTAAAPYFPPAPTNRSAWIAQSGYPTMAVGGSAQVWVQVRNVGTVTWTRGTGTEVRIGVVNDDRTLADLGLADAWPIADRPAVQTEPVVAPGQTAMFRFSVKGARQGSYPLRLRPVIDGLTWLDDEGIYLQITVR